MTIAHRIHVADRAAMKAVKAWLDGQTERRSEAVPRAVVAALVSAAQRHGTAETVARAMWGDPEAELIVRAAVSPATLTQPQWAGILGSTAVSDFLLGLGPVSAASQLINLALQVQLGLNAQVQVPGLIPSADAARFVAEGQPIPVTQAVLNGPTVKPAKIASMVVLSRETVLSTAAEPIVRDYLAQSAGLALDVALFGNAAAVEGERPAGLRNGVTPLAATTGGGDAALAGDLRKLAEAITPVAGEQIVLIGSSMLPLRLALARVTLPYPVLASAALPSGTLMAVAVNSLVTAVDPLPEIEASAEGIVHMETNPSQISTAGSPPATAAPTRSLWQTDMVGVRVILSASWAIRSPGSVAVIEGATW